MTITPDQWMFAVLTIVGSLLAIGYMTGSLAEERRKLARPLAVGRLVNVDAGDHAGLAGWVHLLFVNHHTGEDMVTVHLNDGSFVTVRRADVSPLCG